MANKIYTAVANNNNSISIYEVDGGNYVTSIFVTTGQIIGQPIVSANTITVTFTEGGSNYMAVYDGQRFNFIRKQTLC